MKRDLSVLTDEVKSLIQTWLDIGDYGICPFEYSRRERSCHYKICSALFPLLRAVDGCPCHIYSTNYVVRMAKEFVR